MLKELKSVYETAFNNNNNQQRPNEGIVDTLTNLRSQSFYYIDESSYQ